MSDFRREAIDGAVVTVDWDRYGWSVNCTGCGYVCSDPDDERWTEEQAAYHEGWHEAEYQRTAALR